LDVKGIQMASFLSAPRTGNAVADPNAFKRLEQAGGDRQSPGFGRTKAQTFESLLPPRQLVQEQFAPQFTPGQVPVVAGASGVASQAEYLSVPGAPRRDVTTLFHARPPTAQQFPRALDSENLLAAPGRVRVTNVYKVFSKPRALVPGANPFGFNITPSG
jgi:hypothetical protein